MIKEQLMVRSPFVQQLATLLTIDIVLGFIYAVIPLSISPLRTLVAAAQLLMMAITMLIAMRRVLEDY